jgi:hypothetical protein
LIQINVGGCNLGQYVPSTFPPSKKGRRRRSIYGGDVSPALGDGKKQGAASMRVFDGKDVREVKFQ